MNSIEKDLLERIKELGFERIKMSYVILDYMDENFKLFERLDKYLITKQDDEEYFRMALFDSNIICYLDPEIFTDDTTIYAFDDTPIFTIKDDEYFEKALKENIE